MSLLVAPEVSLLFAIAMTTSSSVETCAKPLSGSLKLKLARRDYLFEISSLADFAVMPFVSQFMARVEKKWFVQSEYQNVGRWLRSHLESKSSIPKVMKQYPLWNDAKSKIVFFG